MPWPGGAGKTGRPDQEKMATPRIAAGALLGPGGAAIPAGNVEVLRVRYVHVTQPTDATGVAAPWPSEPSRPGENLHPRARRAFREIREISPPAADQPVQLDWPHGSPMSESLVAMRRELAKWGAQEVAG